jgi:hypothetical protein
MMLQAMERYTTPMFVFLLLVGCRWTNNVVIDAYPNEAGGCHGNKPAVQGSHIAKSWLDNGRVDINRMIRSGSIEDETKRHVYVNGLPVPATVTVELQYGIEYLVEIIATGGKPFKGVLIRFESLAFTTQARQQGVPLFTLKPLTNAQAAEACSGNDPTSTIQGVTHFDNSMKYTFSSSLILDPPTYNTTKPSYYAMDVTIVDYNNSTGSVYWYSQYTFQGVVELSKDDEHIIPVASPTKASLSPTSSPYPTYTNKCHVCGDENSVVIDPTLDVLVFNEQSTCGEIQHDGQHGLLPPQHCTIIQAAVQDACGCQKVEDVPVVAPSTTTNAFPTIQPTMTANPTKTALPTFSEKCFVCNGDKNQVVMNSLQLIQLQGVAGTCIEMHDDGMDGYIPPGLCGEAQQQAALYCNCTAVPDVSPTVSPAPSISPYPTYSEKCYVCNNDENQYVTAVDQIIDVNGRIGTCLDLQKQGLNGYIHPSLCSDAQQIASSVCECKRNDTAPTILKTFAPSISPRPTSSISPTYVNACYVCGGANIVTTLPDAIVAFAGVALTCKDLENAGLQHDIPPNACHEAQNQALLSCACTPKETNVPPPTALPTFSEKCSVCGDVHMKVTHLTTLVLVQDQVLNCEELSTAGTWGLIPPQYCDEAKKMASEFCGCTASSASPPSTIDLTTLTPTFTPQPTVTSSPSYHEKCSICVGNNDGTNDNPADSTRTVRNTNGENNPKSGVFEYDGILWDCDAVEELGDSGNISPELCPIFQGKAQISCPCNVHMERVDPPLPKSTSNACGDRWTYEHGVWLIIISCITLIFL